MSFLLTLPLHTHKHTEPSAGNSLYSKERGKESYSGNILVLPCLMHFIHFVCYLKKIAEKHSHNTAHLITSSGR